MGGLGEAIAVRLPADGVRVAVMYSQHNDHVAQWLAAQRNAGSEFTAFPVGVTDFTSCQRWAASQVRSEVGDVVILTNNCRGGTRDRTLRKMEKADWNFVLRTDLDSRFHTTRPLVEPMMARGWGRIVSISSVNAFAGGRADRNSRQNPAASSQTSES